jgi:hypothetical protein
MIYGSVSTGYKSGGLRETAANLTALETLTS